MISEIYVYLCSRVRRFRSLERGSLLLLASYSLVAFGKPMHPNTSWLEIVMGGGLLIGGIALVGRVIEVVRQDSIAKWGLSFAGMLFCIPLGVGVLRENALSDIARDIFPLAFLLGMPILLTYSASSTSRANLRLLIAAIMVFVGICSAITFYWGVHNIFGSTAQMMMKMRGGLEHFDTSLPPQVSLASPDLAQVFLKLFDPALLFCATFLTSWGVVLMVRSYRGWLPGIILVGIGLSVAYAFMVTGLRAFTALFILAIATICLTQLRQRSFYVRVLPALFLACALFWPQIDAVLQGLWIKQQAVGSNGKAKEWLAVAATIFAAPQTMLFGIGWGGTFENPILLGESSRFTHSMLSFFLLKSGVIGMGLLLAVIGLLSIYSRKIGDIAHADISHQILLASCVPTLVIGVLFEPTYKMLSYGVVLALFMLLLPVNRQLPLQS